MRTKVKTSSSRVEIFLVHSSWRRLVVFMFLRRLRFKSSWTGNVSKYSNRQRGCESVSRDLEPGRGSVCLCFELLCEEKSMLMKGNGEEKKEVYWATNQAMRKTMLSRRRRRTALFLLVSIPLFIRCFWLCFLILTTYYVRDDWRGQSSQYKWARWWGISKSPERYRSRAPFTSSIPSVPTVYIQYLSSRGGSQ